METAHLNLHQNGNLYGHACKTFHGSHTTLKQTECSVTSADVTGTECTVGFFFGRVQWKNNIVF